MSFGLTFDKLLVIAVIAVILLGPDRLPYYASQLARLVKSLRRMASGAKDRMREEMGPDFDDIDWQKLDPRQYDPRRIIRDALLEEEEPAVKVRKPVEGAYARRQREAKEKAAAEQSGVSAADGATVLADGATVLADEATVPAVVAAPAPFDTEST